MSGAGAAHAGAIAARLVGSAPGRHDPDLYREPIQATRAAASVDRDQALAQMRVRLGRIQAQAEATYVKLERRRGADEALRLVAELAEAVRKLTGVLP